MFSRKSTLKFCKNCEARRADLRLSSEDAGQSEHLSSKTHSREGEKARPEGPSYAYPMRMREKQASELCLSNEVASESCI